MKRIVLVVILAAVLLATCTYTVSNTNSVIVTRLGDVSRIVNTPGIHMKIPFLEKQIVISNMLMHSTTDSKQMLTKDKKYINIDTYYQWRVKDPKRYYLAGSYFTSKGGELSPHSLSSIVSSALEIEVARHELINVINEERTNIMDTVIGGTSERALEELGIELLDIRIRKADLPKANESNIFARMITERERIAKQYRSEGLEEAQKIRARTDRDVATMIATAERDAQVMRGKADAEAINLYAKAFSVDPDFYEFNKVISFYKETDRSLKIIINTDSKMFNVFKDVPKDK